MYHGERKKTSAAAENDPTPLPSPLRQANLINQVYGLTPEEV
jgi:hypothetical protein